MHASHYSAVRLQPLPDERSVFWAVAASILMHGMIAYVYPYLQRDEDPIIKIGIDVQMNIRQLPATVQTSESPKEIEPEPIKPPEPPKPVKPAQKVIPKPTKKPPILATQSNEPNNPYQIESRPVTKAIQPPTTTTDFDVATQPNQANTTDIQPTQHNQAAQTDSNQQQSAQANTQPATDSVASEQVLNTYGSDLYTMVNKMKQYPPIAIRRHLEGSVEVLARFKQGKLIDVELLQTSEHASLNDEAIRSIKKAIQQVALNTHLEGKTFTVTIPVNFALE